MIEYMPGIVFLVGLVLGGVLQRKCEKASWNEGICAESGKPWKCFDMDSQGGRGYKDECGHWTWISYDVDIDAKSGTGA